ncbi:hypothetical protein ACFXKC_50055 [Streptomyces sp. NPDC059340]|uniref:hypothetical protein n=1 Tax=Streptomyces sp. NPDC059340 TaxID=3346806 RepID=UPI0036B8327B
MLTFAVALKYTDVPVPEIAKKLVIKTGKNAGKNPSVTSLYRALAEAEGTDASAAAYLVGPRRPVRARSTGPGPGPGPGPEGMERLTGTCQFTPSRSVGGVHHEAPPVHDRPRGTMEQRLALRAELAA